MGLLTKLKSLLGLEDDRSQVRRTESGVTIEREPDESAEPNVEAESAVKGVDTGTEESADATESDTPDIEDAEPTDGSETADETESTDDAAETGISTEDVTTAPEGSESAETGRDAAEPAEAVQPSSDAAHPDQSAGDEPEPTPEETEDSESDAAEEPVGEGEPLEEIKGIGSAYAERLRDAGVTDVTELAKADAEQLADETGLSDKRISTWIERAQAR
ncbi:helix-hairpin-helix domain-containing protein [Halorussus pelagicus]|uniref:helix-hairpin-helix domain-containing protein n=1 Tax=Halorussus pelagicus TaxID=2505977 RepID=UPI000FFC0C62|nr:helix-hairpin-helix domain-containing protein [Halorussus pelagicus]